MRRAGSWEFGGVGERDPELAGDPRAGATVGGYAPVGADRGPDEDEDHLYASFGFEARLPVQALSEASACQDLVRGDDGD